MLLGNLASLCKARFHSQRNIQDIDDAVGYTSEALESNQDPDEEVSLRAWHIIEQCAWESFRNDGGHEGSRMP